MRNYLISTGMTIIQNKRKLMSVGEDVQKWGPSCITIENVYDAVAMEKAWWFPKRLNIQLPYDPIISLLSIGPKN